jgi:hypothetical protein
MRTRSLVLTVLALTFLAIGAGGCDDKPAPGATGATAATGATGATDATGATAARGAPASSATASATASAPSIPMPPRPVPLGSSGPIQPSSPPEQQMMAIAYTLALVTPRGNDPITVDATYLDDIVKKLDVAVRGIDKGKTPASAAKPTKGNRKIEVLMGHGCSDHVPAQLMQRASTTLKAAYEAGVLVISCHDDKWECHQSTRDPKDVLCHAAPRR